MYPSSPASQTTPTKTPEASAAARLVRVDQLLVEQGLVRSRTRAQRLIKNHRVSLVENNTPRIINRASEKLPSDCRLTIEEDPEERYVSRAGLKLEGLLESHQLRLDGQTLIDIGQSTGGFTDCALRFGAARVIGIEVGHAQLDASLADDERVICLEGINARSLPNDLLQQHAPDGFDGAMMDVSFISQTLILPEIARILPSSALLFSLVKPQFELTPEDIDQKGLVRHPHLHDKVKHKLMEAASQAGFKVLDWQPSVILGGDGNQEWMMLARRV